VSPSNGYIVYRPLDGERVQRDTMTGPTSRMFVSIAETVEATSPNEIKVSGSTDGKKLTYTIRVDGQCHRVMTWSEDGVTSVENGVWTEKKYEMPWLNKCGERPSVADCTRRGPQAIKRRGAGQFVLSLPVH
jgi:hypothetical protein